MIFLNYVSREAAISSLLGRLLNTQYMGNDRNVIGGVSPPNDYITTLYKAGKLKDFCYMSSTLWGKTIIEYVFARIRWMVTGQGMLPQAPTALHKNDWETYKTSLYEVPCHSVEAWLTYWHDTVPLLQANFELALFDEDGKCIFEHAGCGRHLIDPTALQEGNYILAIRPPEKGI